MIRTIEKYVKTYYFLVINANSNKDVPVSYSRDGIDFIRDGDVTFLAENCLRLIMVVGYNRHLFFNLLAQCH